jgi:hypothetical protein
MNFRITHTPMPFSLPIIPLLGLSALLSASWVDLSRPVQKTLLHHPQVGECKQRKELLWSAVHSFIRTMNFFRFIQRIANRLLRRVRDYAEVKGKGEITIVIADAALKMLDVDPVGFDLMDRKLLEAVLFKFSGGPVGLDNLAAAIGEERDTIEDVLEPYLIQQGYLQRTPRGRIATPAAYRHFGVRAPRASPNGDLWDSPA